MINERLLSAYWRTLGIGAPVAEHHFHPTRKWRFDYAWPDAGVAVEVQGGIWTQGRHTRGAALKKEWEKLNTAAARGWRILYCEPKELMTLAFAKTLKAAIDHEH